MTDDPLPQPGAVGSVEPDPVSAPAMPPSPPPRAAWTTRLSPLAAAALAAALFLGFALGLVLLRPALPVDETRYLTVAWEMSRDGSYSVPHLNGALYSHKPPLLFWLINLVWMLVGDSELAARMVAPAFGAVAIVLTGVLSRHLWPQDRARAVIAPLIFATSPITLLYGSMTMFDTMLASATLLALIGLVRARAAPSLAAWAMVGAGLGFGVLAKGPVILVHVMPVALALPLWAERANRPALAGWYRGLGLALLIGLALAALWLVPALILGGPDYRADLLWRQSAGRMVDSFAHGRPIWFFLALMPLYLWPWGWTRSAWSGLTPRFLLGDEASRFCLIWFAATLTAFSLISGKQLHYLIPALPALALLVARGLALRQTSPQAAARPGLWHLGLLLPVAVPVIGGLLIALGLSSFGTKEALTIPLLTAFASFAAFVGLGLMIRFNRQLWLSLALLAPAAVLILHLLAYPSLVTGYDAHPVAARLAEYQAKGSALYGPAYQGEFTYAGRLTTPLATPATPEDLAAFAETHPGGLILTTTALALPDPALPGLTPLETIPYMGRSYSLYTVASGVSP